jgi:hypothetical protein
VHPVTRSNWKKKLKDDGAKAFGGDNQLKEKEKTIVNLERMVGQREAGIDSLKNFGQGWRSGIAMTTTEKVRLTGQCKEDYGLNRRVQATGLPKSTYGNTHRRTTGAIIEA